MTKLEELTALLVNEINDFNSSVDKLEQINMQLKDTKVKMDLNEYKVVTEEYLQKMASYVNKVERFEKRFENKIKQAKIYPNWAVIVFIVCLIFGIVSTSFILFNLNQF
jgi:vancomycin resistance protein YoaR